MARTASRWTSTALAGALVGVLTVAVVGWAADDTGRAEAPAPAKAQAQDDEDEQEEETVRERTIAVVGEGKVTVKPDIAYVQMGVRVVGTSAQEVLDEANEKAALLLEALTALGVDEDDIATAGISIHPQYNSNGNTVTGFEASNDLTVTIRDIARAGEIIDGGAAFAGDAATIGGISFSVADPESVLADARADAIDNARKRAGEYAAAAGADVGEVVMISETGTSGPIPFGREYATADTAGGVPISTGTTDLSATVTVVFELV